MAIKIEGTQKVKSGGGGIGSLLGKIIGGAAAIGLAPVTGGASLAAGLTGANVGGALGGAVGGAVNPAKQMELGVPIEGARDSGFGAPKPKTSAIDRLNSALNTGMNIYGGVSALNNLSSAPKKLGASTAMDRRLLRME